MEEMRTWGEYKVLFQKSIPDGSEALVKHMVVQAGQSISYQYHQHRSEIWTIIQGRGEFLLEGKLTTVRAGDIVTIPLKARHSLRAIEELHLIEVQMGKPLTEDDIVRLAVEWKDVSTYIKARKTQ